MDISSIDYQNEESQKISKRRVNYLVNEYRKKLSNFENNNNNNIQNNKRIIIIKKKDIFSYGESPFLSAMTLLIKRSFINIIRNPLAFTTRPIQAISLAFVIAICWLHLGNDQMSIQNRIGFLYQAVGV